MIKNLVSRKAVILSSKDEIPGELKKLISIHAWPFFLFDWACVAMKAWTIIAPRKK